MTDNGTGLVWQRQADEVGHSLDDAVSWCGALSLDGGNWRLPSIEELITIADPEKLSALPPVFTDMPGANNNTFWANSSIDGDTADHWVVDFSNSRWRTAGSTGPFRVRCVRGP